MRGPSYSDTIRTVYEAATEPNRWQAVIGVAAEHIGALGGILVFNDIANNTGRIITGGALREDLGEVYIDQHVRNPWTEAMGERMPTGPIVANRMVADTRTVFRSAFAADILDPQGVRDFVCFSHPMFSAPGTVGGFGFGLDANQDEEADEVARRLSRLLPHMNRALELSHELIASDHHQRASRSLIELLPEAALLLDGSGRLLEMNGPAAAALATGDVLSAEQGRLRLAPAWRKHESLLAARITEALAQIDDQVRAPRLELRIPRGQEVPPIIFLFTPLAVTPLSFWEAVSRHARLLVQLIDPLADPAIDAGLLRELFGLTATEAKVARLIVRGLSAPQIAAAVGAQPSTVRTHILRCFDKTGVHSQVALTRLLLPLVDGRTIRAPYE